jgi:peptidoglycan/LPS O-acetylase OafA/YrhL
MVLLAHAGAPFPRSGGVGVDVFFTLSGFLITGLLLKEHAAHGNISLRNFYIRRFLRLIPCLWLTVLFFLLTRLLLRGATEWWPFREAGLAVTYAMNWARAMDMGGRGGLGHTWSLAIEEQYYLLWPLVIAVMCRHIRGNTRRGQLLLLLAGFAAGYRMMMVGQSTPGRIYFGLDTHADGLLIGSGLACFIAARGAAPLSERAGSAMRRLLTPAAIATLVAVTLSWTWEDRVMGYAGYSMCAVASAVVILDMTTGATAWLQWITTRRPLIAMGKISYGLYLWHFPIYGLLGELDFMWDWKRKLLLGGPLTLLASVASFHLVEKRFLAWKDRFAGRPAETEIEHRVHRLSDAIPRRAA